MLLPNGNTRSWPNRAALEWGLALEKAVRATALRAFFDAIAHAVQEVRIQAKSVYASSNRAAVVFRGKAIGKNQKPVEVAGIDVFEFKRLAGSRRYGRIGMLPQYSRNCGSRFPPGPPHHFPIFSQTIEVGQNSP